MNGFRCGFDLGYRDPSDRQDSADNLPISIRSLTEIWIKIMKEVKLNRYAGPFNQIPYTNYIQSPIGLVPKDDGKKTRLIFHTISKKQTIYQIQLNFFTPDELCSVKYNDLDTVIKAALRLRDEIKQGLWSQFIQFEEFESLYFSKTDAVSAFRICLSYPSTVVGLFLKLTIQLQNR